MSSKDQSVVSNDRYEYSLDSLTKLSGHSCIRITIPYSLITNTNLDVMRIAVFSYFYVRKGLDGIFYFSVNSILQFLNKVSNRHKGGINDKVISIMKSFMDMNYLKYDNSLFDEKKRGKTYSVYSQFLEAEFLSTNIYLENDSHRFATLYWDEVLKIMSYQNPNKKDVYLSNLSVLLVFAYIRCVLPKRSNKLRIEDTDIKSRQLAYPEAYNTYYRDIADEIGISDRTVSKSFDILKELGLIYCERFPTERKEKKFKTGYAIFSNTYKREKDYLLGSGKSYYLPEIQNKKNKIKGLIKE